MIVVAKLEQLSRSVMDFRHLVEAPRKQRSRLVVMYFDDVRSTRTLNLDLLAIFRVKIGRADGT